MTTRTLQPLISTSEPTPAQAEIVQTSATANAALLAALAMLEPSALSDVTRLYKAAAAIYDNAVQINARGAAPAYTALVTWIQAAPDQHTRRYRQAVAYYLTGNLYNPTGAAVSAIPTSASATGEG